jgi:hypothetical protein
MERAKDINKNPLTKSEFWFCGKVIAEPERTDYAEKSLLKSEYSLALVEKMRKRDSRNKCPRKSILSLFE